MRTSQRIQEYLKPPVLLQDIQVLKKEILPLPDEPFCATWQAYLDESSEKGLYPVLRQHLVQLQFPVREGMSQVEAYRKTTRQGFLAEGKEAIGLELQCPEKLKLYFYQTLAGRLPVLYTEFRSDFELLVQVFSARNEPVLVPLSLGAYLIKGYNNWDRVSEVRRQQAIESLIPNLVAAPNDKYRSCQKEYQDCFMILSAGEYSGVTAEKMGFSTKDWRRLSLIIRQEHEATHYFTKRVLGFMRNHIIDELIADFMGIVMARGEYDPTWQLIFLGLEDYPRYRKGARLENYVQAAGFSEDEFLFLQEQVIRAVEKLDDFYRKHSSAISLESGRGELLLELLKLVAQDIF